MENSTQSSYFDFHYFSAATGDPLASTASVNPSSDDIRWSVLYFFLQHGHFSTKHTLESLSPLQTPLGIPKVPPKVYVYFSEPKVQHAAPPLAARLIIKERLHQWNVRMRLSWSIVVDPGQHDIIALETPEGSESSDMLDPEQSRHENLLEARAVLKNALHRTQISIGAAMLAYEKGVFILGYLDSVARNGLEILNKRNRSGLPAFPSIHDCEAVRIRRNELLEKGNESNIMIRRFALVRYDWLNAAEKFRIEVRKMQYDVLLISSSFVADIDWDATDDSNFFEAWGKIYICTRKIQPIIVRLFEDLQTTLSQMDERVARFEQNLRNVDPEELTRWKRMTEIERRDAAFQVLPFSNIEQVYTLAYSDDVEEFCIRFRRFQAGLVQIGEFALQT